MATLPTVPSFTANSVPSVATLNQLSGSVSFVSKIPIVVSLKRSSDQSISANTNTAVQWNVSETDSDGMHSNVTNPSRLTCHTQGYYRIHAVTAMTNIGVVAEYQAWFQQTTGSNNPLGSGITQMFAADASVSNANSADQMALSIRSLTPCQYINDYVEVFVNCGNAVSVIHNWRSSGNNDIAGNADGSSCVYAYYCFEGP